MNEKTRESQRASILPDSEVISTPCPRCGRPPSPATRTTFCTPPVRIVEIGGPIIFVQVEARHLPAWLKEKPTTTCQFVYNTG